MKLADSELVRPKIGITYSKDREPGEKKSVATSVATLVATVLG